MQTPVMVTAAGAGLPPGIVPEVPFPPLGMTGIAIATRGRRAWELLLTAVFAAAHLSVLLGLRNATPAAASESLADFETATYLDIPPPTSVASPRRVAKPRPVGVSAAVTVPAVQEAVVRPDKAAGFQELTAPSDLQALPPPDPGDVAVDERDYTGRGVVGGVAGGKPPPVIAADLAADLAREGRLSDAVETAADQPVAVELVTVKPQLTEPGRDARAAAQALPPVAAAVRGGGVGHRAVRGRHQRSRRAEVGDARLGDPPPVRECRDRGREEGQIYGRPDRLRRRDAGSARDGPGSAQVDPGKIEIGRAP